LYPAVRRFTGEGMGTDIRHQMVAILPRLRAFARSLARERDAADDLVQATCERALRAVGHWQPGTRLDSWMFRIMRNLWIDEFRKTRATLLDDPEKIHEVAGDDGDRTTESSLMLARTQRAIADLPEEQRSALVLVCVEELSYREAAEVLEIPVGTVMSRLARARIALAEMLGDAKQKPSVTRIRVAGEKP
jgi:RNA polymerase sigma-70 factor (ECF subfamily)